MNSNNDITLQMITSKLQTLPQASPVPMQLLFYLQKNLLSSSLNIKVSGRCIIVNNQILDLEGRNKMFQVFYLFVTKSPEGVTRDMLIQNTYCEERSHEMSLRQKECFNHNMIKLISRARQLAQKNFQKPADYQLDWFPYDPCSQTWKLYSIRPGLSHQN